MSMLRYFAVGLLTLIGATPSEPLCRAAPTVAQQVSMPSAAPGTGAGGVPTQINTAADRRQRGPVPPI